ncbi:hypothetical protein AUR64_05330 [Haloprofundus marisrubri]|uniref:Uncharacterized protein n=1 Tax=Haloprofundus marisrubri TaxID=1514971 RepID=A0A0W1RCH4_9EURY|nr:hypothetical protein [Haloprofundus marisrubri]KTG11132.1 hypothetical protein AUR64_05330 [Haloprofundus marisrubri]
MSAHRTVQTGGRILGTYLGWAALSLPVVGASVQFYVFVLRGETSMVSLMTAIVLTSSLVGGTLYLRGDYSVSRLWLLVATVQPVGFVAQLSFGFLLSFLSELLPPNDLVLPLYLGGALATTYWVSHQLVYRDGFGRLKRWFAKESGE